MTTATRILAPELTWSGAHFVPGTQIEVLPEGRIGRVGADLHPAPRSLPDIALLPGFVNAHSHAFQIGLRGHGQVFPAGAGSFWSWRQAMYELVEGLDEQSLHELARRAFQEMRTAGITAVGEFHYLHHLAGDDFRLDAPVVEAARAVGLRLSWLYAYYRTGGAPVNGVEVPLTGGQERFRIADPEVYRERLRWWAGRLDPARERLGIVVHSLRAAPPEDLADLHELARRKGLVFHLHAEEQPQEIADVVGAHGRRPLQIVLERGSLQGTAAVHLTHSCNEDLASFGAAGGRAVLCPVTEADLGDGLAPLPALLEHRVPVSLGTDSNVRISMLEEMRWLEYGQRLTAQRRGVALDETGAVAPRLLHWATRGGAAALGLPCGRIATGDWADFVAVDLADPGLGNWTADSLPAALVFGAGDRVVRATCIGGVWDAEPDGT